MIASGSKRAFSSITSEKVLDMSESAAETTTPTGRPAKRPRESNKVSKEEHEGFCAKVDKITEEIKAKYEIVDRELNRTKATLRGVHRDLVHNDLRITNVPKTQSNGGERDARATFRLILAEGLKLDNATVDQMCDPARLARAAWIESRSVAKGGGRNSTQINHVLVVRLTNDNDVRMIFAKKADAGFRNYKLTGAVLTVLVDVSFHSMGLALFGVWCLWVDRRIPPNAPQGGDRPVSINRNFSADDRWDQIRCRETALQLCRKKGWDMKNAVKLLGNKFKANGVVKNYVDWIKEENLIMDPAKMGVGWVPPPGVILAAAAATPAPGTSHGN